MVERQDVLRRFILLGGDTHYAKGGFNDFISSHDSLDAAVAEARRRESLRSGSVSAIDWWHVWDCVTNSVVAKSESQAYGVSGDGPELPAPTEVE
jgi:flavin-binding protein dodecin